MTYLKSIIDNVHSVVDSLKKCATWRRPCVAKTCSA
jgi:hypothetical protein